MSFGCGLASEGLCHPKEWGINVGLGCYMDVVWPGRKPVKAQEGGAFVGTSFFLVHFLSSIGSCLVIEGHRGGKCRS